MGSCRYAGKPDPTNYYEGNNMSQLDTDARILGASFLDYQQEVIIHLGTFKVTRQECATLLGLSNTHSARSFQRQCEALDIRTVAGLFATNPAVFADAKRFGAGTMNVAIRVLRKNGHSILEWYAKAFKAIRRDRYVCLSQGARTERA
jgi:hypothetical protein